MRSDRLLSLLLMLQARGRLTAPDAARELEVSVRTVYRDVEALSAAGVPVWTTPGRHGGIELMPGYRTDVTGMTAAESRALVALSGRAVPDDLGLGSALASAVHKLVAAVPASHRPAAQTARERVLVDHAGWYRTAPAGTGGAPHLAAVQDAVWEDRRLRVRYRHGDRRLRTCTLDPWGLVLKAGVWYLVAARRGVPRLYRVDRVEATTTLTEAAHRPAGLDLEAVWTRLRADVERPRAATTVRLRVRADLRDLVERVTAAQRTDAPVVEAGRRTGADGVTWEVLDLEFRAAGAARATLLGFGDGLEVLAPDDLRTAMAATARAVVALYEGGPQPV